MTTDNTAREGLKIRTIERVRSSGKWLEMWFREGPIVSGCTFEHHATEKIGTVYQMAEQADFDRLLSHGLSGFITEWEGDASDWRIVQMAAPIDAAAPTQPQGGALTDEQIILAGMNHFRRAETADAALAYIAAVRECLALAQSAPSAPQQAGDGLTDERLKALPWLDGSTAGPLEKARRVLRHLIARDDCYFYEDGFPRFDDLSRNAANVLAVLDHFALLAAPAAAPAGESVDSELSQGAIAAWRAVARERRRQIAEEGWTPEHDDEHADGQIAAAAACYASSAAGVVWTSPPPAFWPWDLEWFKPSTQRRDLVKAGALILAEIERLDRAEGAHNAFQAKPPSDEFAWKRAAENTTPISADSAVNSLRAQIIARAVAAHDRKWPEQLTSGVMFYQGERITKAEFLAEVRA